MMGSSTISRRLTLLALLAASARMLLAEDARGDDVDRTDFSERHLEEDRPSNPLGPATEVTSVGFLPDISSAGVPVGIDSFLLTALSNQGSRMYNVTDIDGYLLEASSSKKLEVFKKRTYGEPLNPREQRSFRYNFAPSAERKLGEYRLVFSAYYTNKEKDPFMDVVFNETIQLVAAPVSDEDMMRMLMYVVAGAVPLLLGALFIFCCKSKAAEPASSKAKAGTKDSKDVTSNEWLQNTSAASQERKKSKRG